MYFRAFCLLSFYLRILHMVHAIKEREIVLTRSVIYVTIKKKRTATGSGDEQVKAEKSGKEEENPRYVISRVEGASM
jgi:hypothetical protein